MTLRESLKLQKSSETETSLVSLSSNNENSPQSSLYSSNLFLGPNSSYKYKFFSNSPRDKIHVCDLSPSFFLNYSYAKPHLSPSVKTPPSNLGSTCMQKYLDSLQSNDEGTTKALTSFNSHVDQMGFLMGNEPAREKEMISPIICKKEAIAIHEVQERKMPTRINQNGKSLRGKNEKGGRNDSKTDVRGVFKKPFELPKFEESKNHQEAQDKQEGHKLENANGAGELTRVLDNIIKNLRGKQEQLTKPVFPFSQKDYDFESDQEEGEKELLTEEESLKVLKGFRNTILPILQFAPEIDKTSKIANTVIISEDRKIRETPSPVGTRGQKKIFAFNKNEIDIPLEISKKILKSSVPVYECKYCGKTFAKGCSLGGHISRLHKGESLDFKQRLQTRNKRVADRVRGKFLKKESVKQLQSLENNTL